MRKGCAGPPDPHAVPGGTFLTTGRGGAMLPVARDTTTARGRAIMVTRLHYLILGVWTLCAATAAMAQTPLADQNSKVRVGLNLVPMPFGTAKLTLGALGTASNDTAFAFGVMPAVDYTFTPYFFVGFEPQLTFNVKGKNASGDAAKMLDLLLRVGGNAPVADTIELYGYLAPGYSIVMPSAGDNATGFVLGFHGGAIFDLTPKLFLNAELGYQLGYQSIHDLDFKLNYFQIGVGAGLRL
jgi:hypothetical protein